MDEVNSIEGRRGWNDGFFGIEATSEGSGNAQSRAYWTEHKRGSEMRKVLKKAQAKAKEGK